MTQQQQLSKLSPGEGIFINRPNGTEAMRLITYEKMDVSITTDENKVRVTLDFCDPFIHPTDKRPRLVKAQERKNNEKIHS